MSYDVKGELLGFPNTLKIEIIAVDEFFSTLKDTENEHISFTMINPYALREYSFDIPSETKALLEMDKDATISIYNILIIQKPLEKSTINFLAPIIINHDNNTLAQVVLDPHKNPDFGMAESIESFKEK